MDSRHETLDQEILNRLIDYLNKYINENIDEILCKEWLSNDIRFIAEYIYSYAHIEVDLPDLLTKKNYLSLDMIPLPNIDDVTLGRIERKNIELVRMMNEINSIIEKRSNVDLGEHHFYRNMQMILTDYS